VSYWHYAKLAMWTDVAHACAALFWLALSHSAFSVFLVAAGGVLQIFGVVRIASGLMSPPLTPHSLGYILGAYVHRLWQLAKASIRRLVAWVTREPPKDRRITSFVVAGAGASLGWNIESAGSGTTRASLNSRVDRLEKDVQALALQMAARDAASQAESVRLQEGLATERAARQREVEGVRSELSAAASLRLTIEWPGVVWILLGTLYTLLAGVMPASP
jgi:outer membrane murein-binding lipoprotein Lpp